ncbi:response regulator [Paenibacillus cremeus]|uniref:Response regulator n=1 Tax=Paenibacillus cremeus TaxID=2163881 RepID=A0A559KGA4_9BACL|nr:response regulator [Paenibacillus cremeus]TVY11152.1 response regulator [Paenibacillus cremeus]
MKYDAILMDLQMPEMDGYEATTRIRELSNGIDTPIIAMTADAMKGVKEQVVKVGMNAYISKPFEPVELFSVLQRVIQGSMLKGYQQTAAAAQPSVSLPVLQVEETLARLGNNQALVMLLMQKFKANHFATIEEIREAASGGDRDQARFLTHTLKGAASNTDAKRLVKVLARLEHALVHYNESSFESILIELNESFMEVLVTLDYYLNEHQKATT